MRTYRQHLTEAVDGVVPVDINYRTLFYRRLKTIDSTISVNGNGQGYFTATQTNGADLAAVGLEIYEVMLSLLEELPNRTISCHGDFQLEGKDRGLEACKSMLSHLAKQIYNPPGTVYLGITRSRISDRLINKGYNPGSIPEWRITIDVEAPEEDLRKAGSEIPAKAIRIPSQ